MKRTLLLNRSQQTAAQIRAALAQGKWSGKLPGIRRLAEQFGVSRDTVREAVRQLQRGGLLAAPEAGRARTITVGGAPIASGTSARLRIGFFLQEPLATDNAFSQDLVRSVFHEFEQAGHECFIAPKSLLELRHSLPRAIRQIAEHPADAWFLYGASRDLVDWFAGQPMPFYSAGGSMHRDDCARGNTLAGSRIREIVGRLVGLGHERIVFITPAVWRKPVHSPSVRMFLDAVGDHGLPVGGYHVPEWDETRAGLQALLDRLFRVTPPTAILVVEPSHCCGVMSFLSARSLQVARDVSLVTLQHDPLLLWTVPEICHLLPDMPPVRLHIRSWLASLGTGAPLRTQKATVCKLVWGGSIGPAKRQAGLR